MEFIIVTGLSGAGKSQAVHCMEDLGYYCVDNMPPVLIDEFIGLVEHGTEPIEKVAFVADIRGGQFFEDLKESIEEIEKDGKKCRIMFLEASDEVLIRRFKETRRSHPLSKGGSLAEDIKKEREKLADIRKRASFIIDTSNFKTAALNEEIKRLLGTEKTEDRFTITVESFGYKHGILSDADWVLDARFLPNPFYIQSLKKLTGNNKKVRDYVLRSYEARDFIARISGLAADIIPNYIHEGKYNLVIGIGCTGGQHRSVVIANELSEKFRAKGIHTITLHRDLK